MEIALTSGNATRRGDAIFFLHELGAKNDNGRADISVIALWLGHESIETTQIYLHADLALKEKALARIAPPSTPPGRYQPPDALLAFLEAI